MKTIDLTKLSIKERWNLMGAMRGPDNGSNYSKSIFSIPVRIALFGRDTTEDYSFPSKIPIVNEPEPDVWTIGGNHYCSHGIAALKIVLKYADQTELTAEELSTISKVVKGF